MDSNSILTGVIFSIIVLLQIVHIILTIFAIFYVIVSVYKYINNNDKKELVHIKNGFIAFVVLFFVPIFFNVTVFFFSNVLYNKSSNTDNNIKIDESKEKNVDINGDTVTNNNYNTRLFIGDSRTVQMYCFKYDDWSDSTVEKLSSGIVDDNGDIWSSKEGIGLNWMESVGIPNVIDNFKSETAVIVLMGVNDLYNIDNYISYLNKNINTWRSMGVDLYFVSVNPTDGIYNDLNNDIVKFNSKIKNVEGIKYIDTYNYLIDNGFNTTDGLHYDKETSNKIYQYILGDLL